MKNNTMTIDAGSIRKHKMDKEELQLFMHIKKSGSRTFKDKTKYNRKAKHKNNY